MRHTYSEVRLSIPDSCQNLLLKILSLQALCKLSHIKGTTIFEKGQLQHPLKQLNLEQDPGHDTRYQDNILQNQTFFLPKIAELKTHCTFYSLQQL